MQFFDTISLGQAVEISGVRETRNGSLVLQARAARGGNVQDYLGAEVGKPEMPVVRVYRDADEVFHKDSLKTFAHKAVTLGHPAEPVTSRTWKDVARGHTGDEVLRDGEFVKIPMLVADQAAIDAVRGGTRELSMGYQCDLDFTAGVSPTGEAYDARQVRITIDHVAIVPQGRAGPDCRIGDQRPSDDAKTMRALLPIADRTVRMKTHLVDGHPVEMSDAAIIAVSGLQKTLATAVADNLTLSTAVKTKDGEILKLQADHAVTIQAKDKEIADLKAQTLTADKLDAAVAERSAVLDAAKPVLGADFDTKGKTVADIRRAAVAKRLGDKAVEGKADEHVAIAFDTLTAAIGSTDPLAATLAGGIQHNDSATTVGDAYAGMCSNLTDAWKGPQHQKAA
ncbi:DUF2213 domain-containing protein [Methylorubrum extorquens]|uniref:DUF2213 domain-containing protein n=1 Tax=Methylorubrum extorquens TaxID=408 RepID=UPI003F64673F